MSESTITIVSDGKIYAIQVKNVKIDFKAKPFSYDFEPVVKDNLPTEIVITSQPDPSKGGSYGMMIVQGDKL